MKAVDKDSAPNNKVKYEIVGEERIDCSVVKEIKVMIKNVSIGDGDNGNVVDDNGNTSKDIIKSKNNENNIHLKKNKKDIRENYLNIKWAKEDNGAFEIKSNSGLIFNSNPFHRNLTHPFNCFHLVVMATSGDVRVESSNVHVFVHLLEKSLNNHVSVNHDYDDELLVEASF